MWFLIIRLVTWMSFVCANVEIALGQGQYFAYVSDATFQFGTFGSDSQKRHVVVHATCDQSVPNFVLVLLLFELLRLFLVHDEWRVSPVGQFVDGATECGYSVQVY